MTRQEVFDKGETIESNPYDYSGDRLEYLIHYEGKFYFIRKVLGRDVVIKATHEAVPIDLVALDCEEMDNGYENITLHSIRQWKKRKSNAKRTR